MTFAEIQADVRRQLNESGTSFWTDQDVKDSLNEGYAEIADATEFYEREAPLSLLGRRTYYDLTSVIADTILTPRHVQNTETQQWLVQTDPRELDEKTYVQWELTEGPPQKWFIRGNWWLGLFPKQASDSSRLRLYFSSIPDALSDDDDVPAFPREFHRGLVSFACSDLMSDQRETTKALEFWKDYKDFEERLKLFTDGRQAIARKVRM